MKPIDEPIETQLYMDDLIQKIVVDGAIKWKVYFMNIIVIRGMKMTKNYIEFFDTREEARQFVSGFFGY